MSTPAQNSGQAAAAQSIHQADAVYYNGTVHSSAEPYAEAMAIADGHIAWLGSDESREHLYPQQHKTAETATTPTVFTDLERDLLTPLFWGSAAVELASFGVEDVPALIQQALSCGYGALRLHVSAQQLPDEEQLGALFSALTSQPVRIFPQVSISGWQADGGAQSITPVNAALDLLDHVQASTGIGADLRLHWAQAYPSLLGIRSWCAEARRRLVLDLGSADTGEVLQALELTHRHLAELGQRPGPEHPTVLESFASTTEEQWQRLVGLNCHVLLGAAGQLSMAGMSRSGERQGGISGLSQALRAGIPTAVLPDIRTNPWDSIRAQVLADSHPVSVRAGFHAQTRSAGRVLSGDTQAWGPLQVGAAASFSRWRVNSLAVQSPNSTVAAWSTDARSRTPLLPYLDDAGLPEFVGTVIEGNPV